MPEAEARTRVANRASSKTGSIGSRAMCAISGRQHRSPGRDREPAEHPLVDEAELGGGPGPVEREPDAQVSLVGGSGGLHQHLAAHAEVAQQGVAAVERQPEVLAAAPGRGDAVPGQAGGEVVGAGEVTAHRPRVQHLDAGDGAPDDVGLEATTDHLDLGQLRHGAPGTRA